MLVTLVGYWVEEKLNQHMNPVVSNYKTLVQNTVAHLKEDLKSIRTGRAQTGLIDGLQIETYGGSMTMKLRDIASITTEGSDALVVVPFDPSTTTDIEKGIQKSPLGLNPQTQGNKMIIRIPPLSQEQREKYIKLISQKVEEHKVSIRNERDGARKKIKALFDAKEITEDDKFRLEKEIDNVTQQSTEEIQTIREHKERDIMEV